MASTTFHHVPRPGLGRRISRRGVSTPLPVILETHRTLTRSDLRADLAALDIPATVIQGTKDASAPIEATGLPTAAMLAHGELVAVDGAGHGLYLGRVPSTTELSS